MDQGTQHVAAWQNTIEHWTHSPRADLTILAQQGDILTVAKGVNGGTNGLAGRQMHFVRAKRALGIG